ncbi:MAG: 1-acyl-sn-glycerol-3-phosphate acyltransferase [Candidatus Pelagibacter sp. TMED106]|jgi:1-acyl-sn-glycerol-3-phosphate acyltransferase|nr:MAG: 1-acyl-sn-glycerol-3-phosphate acyltransferase [Candidatus Pelagibacter sp. TMED106]|tara:strand:+ start:2521 stop:3222 length:702 start_codon:yes stop_codon:yes gene_type:complete
MIRNFLFSIFFFFGIILISIVFIPALLLPKKIVILGGKIMGHWASICLQLFLSTNIVIKGKENLVKEGKFFVASSHQSMFETFFLQTIFNSPVFILKKELLTIPIFGWYLRKIGSISIKRDKITKDNLGFFEDIFKIIKTSNRPLIIFPQGTRLAPSDRSPFKKGTARIYDELKITCQPVAINSGNTWPKKGSKKSNTNITISILEPIKAGIDKETFLKKLENDIYSELDNLN